MLSRLAVLLVAIVAPACLTTPPATAIDAAVDGDPDADPDAEPETLPPCAAGECQQLLAIGLWQHEPSDGSSVALLRRDPLDGSWDRLASPPNSSDSNTFDLDWGDCCGPADVPDGLPDLLAAAFYDTRVSQLRRLDEVLTFTSFAPLPQLASPGHSAQGVWFDVDEDGDLDVLTGLPNLSWNRNTTPGFDSPVSLDAATGRVGLGSWDDEAAPEILVIDSRDPGGDPAGRGTVMLDRSAGGWDAFVPVLPDGVDRAIWCDVHDDPHPDLVVASFYALDIYPNRGSALDGNWLDLAAVRTFPAPEQNYAPLACGDLDGDDRDDVLIGTGSGLRAVLHDRTATTLVWDQDSVAGEGTYVSDVVLADLHHDDRPEILLTLRDGESEAKVAGPVAYLLPNHTTVPGVIAVGAAEALLSARLDALSLAYVEFATPPP